MTLVNKQVSSSSSFFLKGILRLVKPCLFLLMKKKEKSEKLICKQFPLECPDHVDRV